MKSRSFAFMIGLIGLNIYALCHGAGSHVVSSVAGANGTITPASPRMVDHGGSVSFYCRPDYGYTVETGGWTAKWLNNGRGITAL